MSYGCNTCKPLLKARTFVSVPLRLLLDNCQFYSLKLPEPNVLLFTCPSCGSRWEFQVEDDTVWIGYVYAPLHFAGMEAVQFEGLKVTSNSMWLQVTIDESKWLYPKSKPTRLEETWLYKRCVAKAARAKQFIRQLISNR